VAELTQWLDRTERILAEEDQPNVCGDPKIIEIELAKHKVNTQLTTCCEWRREIFSVLWAFLHVFIRYWVDNNNRIWRSC